YLVTNLHGVIQEANQVASDLFHIPRKYLPGLPLIVLIAPEDHAAFSVALSRIVLQAEFTQRTEWEVRLKGRAAIPRQGSLCVGVIRDAEEPPCGLRWLVRDVTALKQSERLAAIGQMVAGLAHESRNALQRSHGCLEMLALEVRDNPRATELVSR